jgi:glyoxylase-like metal-dependent hydrolase (beta-lactamase superfamily II)
MTTTWVCCACATQYPAAERPPERCPICDDPRQYVPHDRGQRWITWDGLLDGHGADIRDDHGFLGIGCRPSFGIGQRALLVPSATGNVLWECTPYLDDEVVVRVEAEGGLAAIAISHPHYYSAMVEWARRFGCPIHLHRADERHVVRPDPAISFWDRETLELGDGLTLVHCGGHFAGAAVLHVRDRRALLSGDIVHVIPDRRHVTFMYSYPNMIPLPPSRVEAIAAALEPFEFDTVHGAWFGSVVTEDGSGAVRRSAERYVRAVTEPGLPS